MAVFKMLDFVRYSVDYMDNAPKYNGGIMIVQSGVDAKDVKCFYMRLKRLCEQYAGVSFLLVPSSTKSSYINYHYKERTGKAGRPITRVAGKKCRKHYHAVVVSQNNSISERKLKRIVGDYLTARTKKRPQLKHQKIEYIENLSIVNYMLKQSDNVYKGGDFDFFYFDNVYYCPYQYDDFVHILEQSNQ